MTSFYFRPNFVWDALAYDMELTKNHMIVGFHVDDSEVTLNVCLGEQFSGGELFFRGVRCEKHVNVESQPEVCILYTVVHIEDDVVKLLNTIKVLIDCPPLVDVHPIFFLFL